MIKFIRTYKVVSLICGGIIVFSTVLGCVFEKKSVCQSIAVFPELTPVEQSFYATGAQLQDMRVSAWVQLSQSDQSVESLTRLVVQTAKIVAEPSRNIEITTSGGTANTIVQAKNTLDGQNVIVTATSTGNPAETYLTINVEKKGADVNLRAVENKIMSIIKENGAPFSITTCLSGWVSGKLEEEKMTRLIRYAFRNVQARLQEGITGPHFVSYTGVTDSIDRSVLVGKKLINLNIAMRHHSTEDRTYVTVASPVITCEY